MDFAACLLALSGACVADVSHIRIEAGISQQVGGNNHYYVDGHDYGGGHLGRYAIVLDQPLPGGFGYTVGWEHRSLIDTTRDAGDNRLFINLSWRPFR